MRQPHRVAGTSLLVLFIPTLVALAQPPARRAAPPWLGITGAESITVKGVVVGEVTLDSPAAKAGLKTGDIITKVGEKPVADFTALADIITQHRPGDRIILAVRRGDKDQELSVALAERPRAGAAPPGFEGFPGRRAAFLGVHSQELTDELKTQMNLSVDKGVIVTEVVPDSPAAKAGLRRDDVILSINDITIDHPEKLRDNVQKIGAGREVNVKYVRGKERLELTAKLVEGPLALPRLPEGFPRGNRPGVELPPMLESGTRIQELERRIRDLEKRLSDLEKRLPPPN